MLIDTHAHLFFENFKDDLDEVIQRAKDEGVEYIIVPATDFKTAKEAIAIAEKYENIYATVGVHPHDCSEWEDDWIDKLREMAKHPKVVAIGEIGLDYFYDFSPKDIQIKAYKQQLDLAIELGLPAIVHNRESNEDIMAIAREYQKTPLRCQFHCFAGSAKDAQELIHMGHVVSFTGNITFKKADSLRQVVEAVQIDNLMIETDSPFLTPVPFRGKRNEPKNVKLVAEKIAEIHHCTVEDVARSNAYNVYKYFGIGKEPQVEFTYQIGESLYINVTNRCNADCVFCDRKGEAVVKGHKLKMTKQEEPPAEVYIKEIGDPTKYKEIVFCGYGEPTIRWDVVKEISKYVKEHNGKTRLNTDGHGNIINKRDITPELQGLIDVVSISLNSVDPDQYAALMRVDKSFHKAMIDFAKAAKKYSKVIMTIVGMNEIDSEKAKEFCTNELGVEFREREYFQSY